MDSKRSKHRPLWLWLYTLIGVVVGTGAIFLSFTFDTSPADVLFFGSEVEFWPIASPFLLAIPISVASLRWLLAGRLSRLEWTTAYALGLVLAGATLFFLGLLLVDGPRLSAQEWLLTLSPLGILGAGVGIVSTNWRAGIPHALNGILAMQVAYLANTSLCLIGFFPGWEIGAYFALVTALLYLAQIVVVYCQRYGSRLV
jgi:hypothetical protein